MENKGVFLQLNAASGPLKLCIKKALLLALKTVIRFHKSFKRRVNGGVMTVLVHTARCCVTLLIVACKKPQPDFRDHICGEDGNYTRNSTYQRTLGTTLSTLPNTNNGFGFFNFSGGESSSDERVYSVALCEGVVFLPNPDTASDPDRFNRDLGLLMNQLRAAASGGDSLQKYASGSTPGPGLITIYGIVQCTPDLSKKQCNDCLEYLSNSYAASYRGRIGGGAHLPMCRYAYGIRQFYKLVTLAPPPPPQDVLNVHAEWVKTSKEIACLMLVSMTPELQKNLEHFGAYDKLWEL
uniref:Cysteine-rich RLK (Receptor-like protein kinase) 26 n=1 Tax=Tanacetum cinerariifolium TaxID=118510 RepID=A0A699H6C5_TANCI|nr:cysteine-rich RLK (receptor-like protein kinase) 26 [Tanacetum cinerariifolium]